VILGVRFLPGLLPELFGLAGIVATALIARYVRGRSSGGFSQPGTSQRTQVHTPFVDAWIDFMQPAMSAARWIQGRFTGRTLEVLADGELLELHAECARDADSQRVLESYLDRRLGADWRARRRHAGRAPT